MFGAWDRWSLPQIAAIVAGASVRVVPAFTRIVASAASPKQPIDAVMASPPTITIHGSPSTLSGATSAFGAGQYQINDPAAVTPLNGVVTVNGTTGYNLRTMTGNVSTAARRIGAGGGWMVRTSAPAIDFVMQSGSAKIVIYVTDMLTGVRARAAANDIVGNGVFNQFLKVNFGSSRDRVIEVYNGASGNDAQGVYRGGTDFRGVNCTTGYSLIAPPTDMISARLLLFGDSHGDHIGSGNTNEVKLCYPDFLAERLGTKFIWTSAAGGTGFLNPVGTSGTYRQRIEDGDLNPSIVGQMDLVMFAGTTNDDPSLNAAYTDAAVQAEVQWCVAQALAQQPNAAVVVVGPHITNTIAPSQSRYDAMKAGLIAGAAGDPRAVFIDNSPAAGRIVTDANKATVIGPDDTHFTNAGMKVVGYGVADRILAALGGTTPAPVFTTQPTMSPTSGTSGSTMFTANDGAASNTANYTRRWLLSGTAIGTGATVTPASSGSLVLEVTATGAGGATVATSAPVAVTTPTPALKSIDSSGLFGVWNDTQLGARPASLTPNTTPALTPVTQPGFTSAGVATTFVTNVIATYPRMQDWPNQAAPSTDGMVALDRPVHVGDTAPGNSSTLAYPKTIARWTMVSRGVFAGDQTLAVEAYQAYGREGLPVRAVRITGTPTTGAAVAKWATFGKSALYGDSLPEWGAVFNPTDFPSNDGGMVRWDFEAFPWIGTATEVRSTLGVAENSISNVGPKFMKQGVQTRRYAFVSPTLGNDGTAVVSATRASAKAAPFATINAAATAMFAASTGGNVSNDQMELMAGNHVWDSTAPGGATRIAPNAWFNIIGDADEADPATSVIVTTSTTAYKQLLTTGSGAWGYVRCANFNLVVAAGFQGFLTGVNAARSYLWLDGMKINNNLAATTAWAFGYRVFITRCSGIASGAGRLFSNNGTGFIIDMVRASTSNRLVQANAIFSVTVDGTTIGGNALSLGDATSGAASNLIAVNCKVTNWLGNVGPMLAIPVDTNAHRDIVFLQCQFTCSNSATNPGIALGENLNWDIDNVWFDYTTVTPGSDPNGGRFNFHNDPITVPITVGADQVLWTNAGAQRTDLAWNAIKDQIYRGTNESDAGAGLLTGGYSKMYGVMFRHNSSRYSPDTFTPYFPGLNSARATNAARLIPAGSVNQALTWDIGGALRSIDGTGHAGAVN